MISKGSLVVVEALHGTSPVSALCGLRILSHADLTPELSRPARGEPVGAEAAKRARLERIVRRHMGEGALCKWSARQTTNCPIHMRKLEHDRWAKQSAELGYLIARSSD